MLCKRIIGVLLLQGGRCVKTRQFKDPRDVGDPVKQAKILYDNGIDEIIVLNIEPSTGIQPLVDILPAMAEECFVPIAAGGGIRTVEDAARLIATGAEKVVIRTAVEIVPAVADRFGCQAVVQCVDISPNKLLPGTPLHPSCGELVINSVDRDGTMQGYEMDLFPKEGQPYESNVPMIMLGGAGNYQHMLDAFEAGVDACAAGSLWAFTDSNPIRAKTWLRNHGVHLRGKSR